MTGWQITVTVVGIILWALVLTQSVLIYDLQRRSERLEERLRTISKRSNTSG